VNGIAPGARRVLRAQRTRIDPMQRTDLALNFLRFRLARL
jgi:hypothetical protein